VNFFDRIFKKDNDRKKMNFSIEIGPHSNIETLPALSDVYVTMLPGGDYKETANKALELVKKGFNPVPHFPARSMNNEQELKDYVNKCKDGGVNQALIIGGGRDPVGKFDSSIQLLETGYFEKMKIGIAGHPEGSPDISDTDLEKAMIDKKPYADYIVTQWLLDPQPIIDFISKQSVPVHVGITGPLKISSLIKFANIVGAKNSLNFLKSNFSKALDLLKPKDPNDLIGKVKSHTDNFHIYTFGGLKETNKWLKENKYVE
jgi:methylenetetrahydrofolate reductase (NADPH)